MNLQAAKHLLANADQYHDGCTRHINCVNVREVLFGQAKPDFRISDWYGPETVYTYTNGREHS